MKNAGKTVDPRPRAVQRDPRQTTGFFCGAEVHNPRPKARRRKSRTIGRPEDDRRDSSWPELMVRSLHFFPRVGRQVDCEGVSHAVSFWHG